LAAAGVWLVLGIQWSSFQWGDLTGILSGVTGGAAVLSVKEARRTDNALTVFGSFSLFGFLFSAAALGIGFWTPLSRAGEWNSLGPQGWGILCLMGFSAMTAQLLFTQGYGHTSLTMGSLLSLLVPVLAAFWGWMLLGEPLTPHFILGTLFVLTACALLAKKEVVSPLS
jgi:drug/metabolite transporter (DMT)-like permease